MIVTRQWAMPSRWTWSIKPIKELVEETVGDGLGWADPFAGQSQLGEHRNDLDPATGQPSNMDALEWLKTFPDASLNGVLFDPPYSPRQVSECYRNLGQTVNMETTQSSFWGNLKKEIARVVKPGGAVITAGWNSGGVGMSNGFQIEKVLLVPHGGWHNDTIVVMERKPEPQTEKPWPTNEYMKSATMQATSASLKNNEADATTTVHHA